MAAATLWLSPVNGAAVVAGLASELHQFRQLPFLLLLLLVANMSCGEPHSAIEIDNQVPPSFKFEGEGAIPFLMVYELPLASSPDMRDAKVIWHIRPNDHARATVPLGPIKYGIVPDGFTQMVPREGVPPTRKKERVIKQVAHRSKCPRVTCDSLFEMENP